MLPPLIHSRVNTIVKKKKVKDAFDHQIHVVFHMANLYNFTIKFLQNPIDYDGAYDYYMTAFSLDSIFSKSKQHADLVRLKQ